jgi:hypothetical protein
MKPNERLWSRLIISAFAIMTLFLQGCDSLQFPAKNGRPEIIGFGYTKSIGDPKGQIYQILSPGLSLRVGSTAPGISFGWHETRLFNPANSGNTNSSSQTVAIQTKCIGVELTPGHIIGGYENTFAIPLPNEGI